MTASRCDGQCVMHQTWSWILNPSSHLNSAVTTIRKEFVFVPSHPLCETRRGWDTVGSKKDVGRRESFLNTHVRFGVGYTLKTEQAGE